MRRTTCDSNIASVAHPGVPLPPRFRYPDDARRQIELSREYCAEHFGLPRAFGRLDRGKLNVDGGAVAIGHPIGASGARVVLHVLEVLRRSGGRRGVASLCIGGGQGGAMLVERA